MFKSPCSLMSERLSFLEKNQNMTVFIKQSGGIHSGNCSQNPCRLCLWSLPRAEHPCLGLEMCVLIVQSLAHTVLTFVTERMASCLDPVLLIECKLWPEANSAINPERRSAGLFFRPCLTFILEEAEPDGIHCPVES